MCGIFGIATTAGRRVELPDRQVCQLRDLLAHRGPDAAGLWRSTHAAPGQFVLAHRRLAILDPSEAGSQPMLLDGPGDADFPARERFAIAYNGELYNDAELREALAREHGDRFVSGCDTETVLRSIVRRGVDEAVARFRGMFAFAFVDQGAKRLTLARDPLGIKPLYYRVGQADSGAWQVVFASEPQAIVAHPDVPSRPDMVTVSAYLTTIRLTLGERSLFEGVRVVQPGEVLELDLSGMDCPPRISRRQIGPRPVDAGLPRSGRAILEESIGAHLRSDVPICALLSGGLDSSIIAAVTSRIAKRDGLDSVRTFASGHDDGNSGSDLVFAQVASQHLGTRHTAAPISRELFADRWPELIERMGVPLGTPNEVAINEVARRLRSEGCVVALSGEGADELFAGYELPMQQAWAFESRADAGAADGGLFQLQASAWVGPELKAGVLTPTFWRGVEHDAALSDWYSATFHSLRDRVAATRHDVAARVQTHLDFHQRVNLVGLLSRLDTATMLAGVEGRTPFADIRVREMAAALPMTAKYRPPSANEPAGTKVALREWFTADLPPEILRRPKASFPVPFQAWVADRAIEVRTSSLIAEVFQPEAIDAVASQPTAVWQLAWPMINLALWGRRW